MPNLIQNPEDIQLTERHEILAIMGNPPRKIIRWGITVIAFFVIGGFIVSYLVEYSDMVPAEVVLTTENPPIPLVAKTSGKITELEVEDKDKVFKNQPLAVIENPAYSEDVSMLEEYLMKFDEVEEAVDYLAIPPPPDFTLGELQGEFARMSQKLEFYKDYLKQRSVFRQMRALKKKIIQINELNESLKLKMQTLELEREIARKEYLRLEPLAKDSLIKQSDYEQAYSAYLRADRAYKDTDREIINNRINIENQKAAHAELKGGREMGNSQKQTEIQELVHSLKGSIEIWKQKYLLLSPFTGIIAFKDIYQNDQPVEQGQTVFTILPDTDSGAGGKIIGRAKLSVLGSGKVEEGQDVNLELAAYPKDEFGVLKCTVGNISDIPDEEGQYLVEINLPEKLITNSDKEVIFRQGMVGTGNIVTKKRRFLVRIFEKLVNAIKNQ